jgi:hypothetical protein
MDTSGSEERATSIFREVGLEKQVQGVSSQKTVIFIENFRSHREFNVRLCIYQLLEERPYWVLLGD